MSALENCNVLEEGELQLAADFIASCLRLDPSKRPSALELQRSPWMKTAFHCWMGVASYGDCHSVGHAQHIIRWCHSIAWVRVYLLLRLKIDIYPSLRSKRVPLGFSSYSQNQITKGSLEPTFEWLFTSSYTSSSVSCSARFSVMYVSSVWPLAFRIYALWHILTRSGRKNH